MVPLKELKLRGNDPDHTNYKFTSSNTIYPIDNTS